jgi:hypothetical protein
MTKTRENIFLGFVNQESTFSSIFFLSYFFKLFLATGVCIEPQTSGDVTHISLFLDSYRLAVLNISTAG